MMDLLHRMGAVTTPQPNQDGCQWVEAAAAVAAISLAGERAGGRCFLDKVRQECAAQLGVIGQSCATTSCVGRGQVGVG